MASFLVDGTRTSGEDIRTQNGSSTCAIWSAVRREGITLDVATAVTACVAIANIVKSSLGPVGLDKMLVRRICGL